MRSLRPLHRLPLFFALVGLLLASALVAVGAHEHDLWGGDTPEGVFCIVDHDAASGSSQPAPAPEQSPWLRAADGPHRHVCVGTHGASHPPAVHRDLTPRPFDAAPMVAANGRAGAAERLALATLPAPRGPPAV